MTPSNTLRASVNQYECSIATPRSNGACTLASQDVGKVTLPSLSWASPGTVSAVRTRRSAIEASAVFILPPCFPVAVSAPPRSEEHTSELQSRGHLVCRLLLEKK